MGYVGTVAVAQIIKCLVLLNPADVIQIVPILVAQNLDGVDHNLIIMKRIIVVVTIVTIFELTVEVVDQVIYNDNYTILP